MPRGLLKGSKKKSDIKLMDPVWYKFTFNTENNNYLYQHSLYLEISVIFYHNCSCVLCLKLIAVRNPGPSCSKLTMLLVNVSLKL